jgi:hypothetical protein
MLEAMLIGWTLLQVFVVGLFLRLGWGVGNSICGWVHTVVRKNGKRAKFLETFSLLWLLTVCRMGRSSRVIRFIPRGNIMTIRFVKGIR